MIDEINSARRKKVINNMLDGTGWHLDTYTPSVSLTDDYTAYYLCDLDNHKVMICGLARGDIEKAVAYNNNQPTGISMSFEESVQNIGAVINEIVSKGFSLDGPTNKLLAYSLCIYTYGTQAYQQRHRIDYPGYLIMKMKDASDSRKDSFLLRPVIVNSPGFISADQLSNFVMQILEKDRLQHPERFQRAKILPFKLHGI